MKLMTTSVTAFAAFGILAGASLSALACDFHKSHVTAAATPPATQDQVAVPATAVDPVVLADAKAKLLPAPPKEDPLEAAAAD
ncbi:MAG TPA: hypothetical protein VFK86_10045 [Bauldia sp.]|nr:hypothetical protein [Bauldia sp.]